jgi:hypothetical protein
MKQFRKIFFFTRVSGLDSPTPRGSAPDNIKIVR